MKEKSDMKARLLRVLGIGVMFAFAFLMAFRFSGVEWPPYQYTPRYYTEVFMVPFALLYGWYCGTFARFRCNSIRLSILIILTVPPVLFYVFPYIPTQWHVYLAVGLCTVVLPWNIRGVLALCLVRLLASTLHSDIEVRLIPPLVHID